MFGDIKSLKNFLNNPPAQLTAMFTGESKSIPNKREQLCSFKKKYLSVKRIAKKPHFPR